VSEKGVYWCNRCHKVISAFSEHVYGASDEVQIHSNTNGVADVACGGEVEWLQAENNVDSLDGFGFCNRPSDPNRAGDGYNCDRPYKHLGPHSWAEPAAEAALLRLREQMTQLVTAWRTEQALYPTHDSGLYAAAAVSCCANELEAELLAPPTDQAGVVPEVKP